MITQSSVPDRARVLSNRMHDLSMMTDIPNMRQYAEEWNKLGADFKAVGYTANSERCYRKFEHYYKKVGSEPELPAPARPYRHRYIFCDTERAWMQHALNITEDFYVCECGSQVEYSADGRRAAVVESE